VIKRHGKRVFMEKTVRSGLSTWAAALLLTALALFGCPQDAEKANPDGSSRQNGTPALTLSGAEGGSYAVGVYHWPEGGVGAGISAAEWAELTKTRLASGAAEQLAGAAADSLVITLLTPAGRAFTATGGYLATVTLTAPDSATPTEKYGPVYFTEGSASVKWDELLAAPAQ
jgi:hypothetical protein